MHGDDPAAVIMLKGPWGVDLDVMEASRAIAPAHCTGEHAFAILKQTFGDRYVYAGLGTTLAFSRAQMLALDADDLPGYREYLLRAPMPILPCWHTRRLRRESHS